DPASASSPPTRPRQVASPSRPPRHRPPPHARRHEQWLPAAIHRADEARPGRQPGTGARGDVTGGQESEHGGGGGWGGEEARSGRGRGRGRGHRPPPHPHLPSPWSSTPATPYTRSFPRTSHASPSSRAASPAHGTPSPTPSSPCSRPHPLLFSAIRVVRVNPNPNPKCRVPEFSGFDYF